MASTILRRTVRWPRSGLRKAPMAARSHRLSQTRVRESTEASGHQHINQNDDAPFITDPKLESKRRVKKRDLKHNAAKRV
jgi:hypothetical protein